jgi:hypothetical protein
MIFNKNLPIIIFKKNLNFKMEYSPIKNSKFYREKKAIREGRTPGRKGRPALLEPSGLQILFVRIRQKVLNKIQVDKLMLVDMVFYLFI